MNQNVTLAVAKGGRILSAQLELLAKIGVEPLDDMKTSRKLIFDTNRENLQLVLLRGADVATYVERSLTWLENYQILQRWLLSLGLNEPQIHIRFQHQ